MAAMSLCASASERLLYARRPDSAATRARASATSPASAARASETCGQAQLLSTEGVYSRDMGRGNSREGVGGGLGTCGQAQWRVSAGGGRGSASSELAGAPRRCRGARALDRGGVSVQEDRVAKGAARRRRDLFHGAQAVCVFHPLPQPPPGKCQRAQPGTGVPQRPRARASHLHRFILVLLAQALQPRELGLLLVRLKVHFGDLVLCKRTNVRRRAALVQRRRGGEVARVGEQGGAERALWTLMLKFRWAFARPRALAASASAACGAARLSAPRRHVPRRPQHRCVSAN